MKPDRWNIDPHRAALLRFLRVLDGGRQTSPRRRGHLRRVK